MMGLWFVGQETLPVMQTSGGTFLLFLLGILVALWIASYISSAISLYCHGRRPTKQRPWPMVPHWLPFVGHLHCIRGSSKYLLPFCEKWADRYVDDYGCFDIEIAGTNYIVICHPDRTAEVLRHRPKFVERTSIIREVVDSFGGTGVFSAEGDVWLRERKLMASALNRANMQEYLPVFRTVTTRLVRKWIHQYEQTQTTATTTTTTDRNDTKEYTEFSPKADCFCVAADAIATLALGQDCDFLNTPNSTIAGDVRAIMQGFGRALSPIWYWRIPVIGQYLDGFGWPRFRINQLIRRAVQHHHPTAPVGDTAGSLFVRRLYQLMIKANGNLQLTEDRVMGNVLTLFIAGIDTTANMLAVCLYILARDTVLQQKIRQHVQNIKIDTVTIDNFYETMPLLKSFLHEIHRMYGNVFLMLELKKDIDFAGVILPHGQRVFVFTRYMATSDHTEDIPRGPNGESPRVFCAERYVCDSGSAGTGTTTLTPAHGSLALGTFGLGVRACPGRTYTEIFSYLVLIQLLQNFEWTLPDDFPEQPMWIHEQVVVPDCPIRIKLKRI